MSKARLDSLRDRMNQCDQQKKALLAEQEILLKSTESNKSAYNPLALATNAAAETHAKAAHLQDLSERALSTQQQIDAERGLIETMHRYLGEHDAQQVMPDVSLLGIEDTAQLLDMIASVNDTV